MAEISQSVACSDCAWLMNNEKCFVHIKVEKAQKGMITIDYYLATEARGLGDLCGSDGAMFMVKYQPKAGG